jgi:hypothetical protein
VTVLQVQGGVLDADYGLRAEVTVVKGEELKDKGKKDEARTEADKCRSGEPQVSPQHHAPRFFCHDNITSASGQAGADYN